MKNIVYYNTYNFWLSLKKVNNCKLNCNIDERNSIRLFSIMVLLLTFGEEVGASAVLADVEVLAQLATSLEAQHGVVMQAVVPEQDAAPRLQHLEQTQASGLHS